MMMFLTSMFDDNTSLITALVIGYLSIAFGSLLLWVAWVGRSKARQPSTPELSPHILDVSCLSSPPASAPLSPVLPSPASPTLPEAPIRPCTPRRVSFDPECFHSRHKSFDGASQHSSGSSSGSSGSPRSSGSSPRTSSDYTSSYTSFSAGASSTSGLYNSRRGRSFQSGSSVEDPPVRSRSLVETRPSSRRTPSIKRKSSRHLASPELLAMCAPTPASSVPSARRTMLKRVVKSLGHSNSYTTSPMPSPPTRHIALSTLRKPSLVQRLTRRPSSGSSTPSSQSVRRVPAPVPRTQPYGPPYHFPMPHVPTPLLTPVPPTPPAPSPSMRSASAPPAPAQYEWAYGRREVRRRKSSEEESTDRLVAAVSRRLTEIGGVA